MFCSPFFFWIACSIPLEVSMVSSVECQASVDTIVLPPPLCGGMRISTDPVFPHPFHLCFPFLRPFCLILPFAFALSVFLWGTLGGSWAKMSGDMSMSSCLSVKAISMSRHITPIPGRKTLHCRFGNPPYLCYPGYLGVRAAMPSSTTAAQRPRQETAPDMGSQ